MIDATLRHLRDPLDEPRPIAPYPGNRRVEVVGPDPAWPALAERVIEIVRARRPGVEIHHIGSTSVPGLAAKPILDIGILAEPADVPAIADVLDELGFEPQSGIFPFPPTRPLRLGGLVREDGTIIPIHAHVMPTSGRFGNDLRRHLVFRDALRANDALRDRYAALKRGIVAGGVSTSLSYSLNKTEFIRGVLADHGEEDGPLPPGSTIGIIGGGQLGRMIGLAAVRLGYRIVVLDPDPDCPAAVVADRVIVAGYGDVDAAASLAAACDVATYELEHIDPAMVRRIDADRPIHPVEHALRMTQDRLAERRFLADLGIATAAWRAVATADEVRAAAAELRGPFRLKAAFGGYDGRSQVRLTGVDDVEEALVALGGRPSASFVLEEEVPFVAELSAIVARDGRGRTATYPVALNRHDDGILVESLAPASEPVTGEIADRARDLAERIALELDLVGVLTVELFLLPDGRLLVNELAPRVHNSGHWTIEGAETSQFEQHVRALVGLPLGGVTARGSTAMANLLGTGPRRPARLLGTADALADPAVHLHVYDKRDVFERRKMGHLTVVAADPGDALARVRAARAALRWDG